MRMTVALIVAITCCGCAPGPKLPKYQNPALDESEAASLRGRTGTYIRVIDNMSVPHAGFLEAANDLGGKEVLLTPGEHDLTVVHTITQGGQHFRRSVKRTFPFTYTFKAGHKYEVGPENWFIQQSIVFCDMTDGTKVTLAGGIDADDDDQDRPTQDGPVQLNPLARGPTFDEVDFEAGRAEVEFDDNGAPLATLDGQPPTGFTLAGTDRIFHDATASIVSEDTVVVQSDAVLKPVAVRLSAETNLVNRLGGPARPFRTDKWSDAR